MSASPHNGSVGSKIPSEPPAELRFRRALLLPAFARELIASRETVRTLAERDLRARYKQTLLGFAWALILPVVLMIVFSLVVDRVADVDTGGTPYPLFSYLGLLPWTFFSTSVNQGGQSLVINSSLLNKVYAPREVFPLASVVVAAVDMFIATSVLALLFVVFGVAPQVTSFWVPALLMIQLAFTTGITLITSALIVYLRDLRHALPIMLQAGLFVSPVAYAVEPPGGFAYVYAAINPLGPVIDGLRRTILLGTQPAMGELAVAALSSIVIVFAAYVIFKRLETGFADVA